MSKIPETPDLFQIPRRNRRSGALVLVLVAAAIVTAASLRPGATSVGPVLPELMDSLGMSGGLAGLLTALPGICFAAIGIISNRLAKWSGLVGALLAGSVLTTLGLASCHWRVGGDQPCGVCAVALPLFQGRGSAQEGAHRTRRRPRWSPEDLEVEDSGRPHVLFRFSVHAGIHPVWLGTSCLQGRRFGCDLCGNNDFNHRPRRHTGWTPHAVAGFPRAWAAKPHYCFRCPAGYRIPGDSFSPNDAPLAVGAVPVSIRVLLPHRPGLADLV